MLMCTATISKLTIQIDCMCTSLTFPKLQGGHLWKQKSFAVRRIWLWRISWWSYRNAFVWTLFPFFTRRMEVSFRPDGFILYGQLGVDFFCTSELLYPIVKTTLPLIRARPNFYMISSNPNGSLGFIDCSLYNRRVALKNVYHKKRKDMLAKTPVEFNYMKTPAKICIFPARQNPFTRGNLLTMLQFVKLPLQWK